MSLNNENNPNEMRVPLGAISANTAFELKRLDKRIRVLDVQVLDPTGAAEDAANYVKVQLLRDAVVIAEHSTQTGNEGALAAGVWSKMPEQDVDVLKGADLSLNVNVAGTGVLNAGSVAVVRYMEA